ncbi:alginate O-acetyltransferase AlgX-related protein [Xylophilus sp.]|uniref:alginate O-acetyltransferase AlgX-related protein n=1 Tax=Xylophilus sp. TaxID=2653893 RepID=UPI0013B93942|nr:cell division protein FtsQ [Xylophilus sp.]KAF1050040.1 MAG: putative alginate O-acetylase AlgJ [Xylophilus sp.]
MASSSDAFAPPPPAAPRAATAAAGVVLLLTLAAGLAGTAWAVATGQLDLLPAPVTREAFLDGRTTRGVADALGQAPPARIAADAERAAGWLLLRDLGPQVRQGCPGWLFLAEELMPHPDGETHARRRAEVVARLHQALQHRGIHLLVAVVPDKSRIAHDRLCGLRRAAAFDGRVQRWMETLRAAGVPAVDLAPALAALQQQGTDAFFRTDTHWNEDGAQRAAEAVARAVRAQGWQPAPPQSYEIVREPAAVRPGDLVRLAGIDRLPLRWQPQAETARAVRFDAVGAGTGGTATEDDLFGDAGLPRTALLGTSFSRNAGFAGFLAHALRTPVANFGRDGGNFSGGAAAYFAGPAWRQTPPRLIIWEIPERTLQRPVQDEAQQWEALATV